jgi:hypothetical protein
MLRLQMICGTCQGARWVCEDHPDRPWGSTHPNGCRCGGAGMPCPVCNDQRTASEGSIARLNQCVELVGTFACAAISYRVSAIAPASCREPEALKMSGNDCPCNQPADTLEPPRHPGRGSIRASAAGHSRAICHFHIGVHATARSYRATRTCPRAALRQLQAISAMER